METSKELNRLLKLKKRYSNQSNLDKLADTIKEIGDLYYESEKFEDAIQEYSDQLDLCETLNDKLKCSIAHRMIGECYINIGKFNDASEHLYHFLAGAQELGNLLEEQRAYATLGRLYFCQAETEPQENKKTILNKAKDAYSKSIMLCNKLITNEALPSNERALMKARLLLNFGLVHETDDFDEACTWLKKAVDICLNFNLTEELNRTYIALASVYERHGNFDDAISYFDIAADTNHQALKVNSLVGKSELLLKLGEYKNARQVLFSLYKMKGVPSDQHKYIESTLKIVVYIMELEKQLEFESSDSKKINIFENLGDSAVKVRCYTKAVSYYEKMLECCETTGSERLGDSLVSLARTLQDMSKYEEAIPYAKRELLLNVAYSDICSSALFLASLQILAFSSDTEIRETFDLALDNARKSNNLSLEKTVYKEQLAYFENTNQCKEASYIREKLDMIENVESSDDENTEKITDSEEFNIDIDLEELSDFEQETSKRSTEGKTVAKKKSGKSIKRNEKGETMLHVACIKGNISQVEKLLKEGHPVNVYDNAGFAPLHEAANFGYTDIAELLIQHGANVNDPGGSLLKGMTPLHDASTNGALGIIKLLIKYGADPNMELKNGQTAYDCLKEWRARLDGKATFSDTEEAEYLETLHLIKSLLTVSQKGREKRKSKMENTAKPRNFINVLMSESDDEPEIVENDQNEEKEEENKVSAAEMYRKTIESLKHRNSTIVTNPKANTSSEDKAPLLDSEELLVDDWLDDDLGISIKGSRRETGSMECKRKSSESCKNNGERAKRQKCSDETNFHDANATHTRNSTEQVLQELIDSESDSDNDIPVVSVRRKPKYKQLSLEKSGVIKFGTSQNSSHNIFNQDVNINQNSTFLVESKEFKMTIFLKERVYHVDVSFPRDSNKTIESILDIIKEQFKEETGCIPHLSLSSLDNIVLSNDRTLNDVTNAGTSIEFLSEIIDINVLPIEQRYNIICKRYGIGIKESTMKSLQNYKNTASFQFTANETLEEELFPLLKTIEYESNLYLLNISGLSLYNLGTVLDCTLFYHTNLSVLVLENCDISQVCLSKLKQLPKGLKILNLSNNPLGGKSWDKLRSLLIPLKELHTLELRYCELSNFQFNSLNETIVNLDVSGNFFDRICMENLTQKFFINLNISYSVQEYSDICIARQISNDIRLLSFTLESLDFSCCKLRDTDIDIILRHTPNLRKIYVNDNRDITHVSVNKLLSFKPTLTYIGIVGCQVISVIPDLETRLDNPKLCTMLVNMEQNVIINWESLWIGTCVANIISKHIVKFEPH